MKGEQDEKEVFNVFSHFYNMCDGIRCVDLFNLASNESTSGLGRQPGCIRRTGR